MKFFAILCALLLVTSAAPLNSRASSFLDAFDPTSYPKVDLDFYAPYARSGHGVISGVLTAKTKLFGSIVFPNRPVSLTPASTFDDWYIKDTAYQLEHPDHKDVMPGFPVQLQPYVRRTVTDSDGKFTFSNLPDGSYFLDAFVMHEEDSHPVRERTEMAMGPDGEMVGVPVQKEGLRIRSDDVVIAARADVDGAHGYPTVLIQWFSVVGEYTCCKAEL
jgi:hypothetical protein